MPNSLKVIFAGTPEFAVPALKAIESSRHSIELVVCQPDRPAGRGRKLSACAVKQVALQSGLCVFQPEKIRDRDSIATLVASQSDIMVVVAYGQLLSSQVLAVPRYGCINIHASLLPRWRGAAPIQRAILAGDRETGITIMHMVEALDAGDIIKQACTPIRSTESAADLHDQLAQMGAQAVTDVLDKVSDQGCLKGEAQEPEKVTYANKLSKAEAEIDWHHASSEVARCVRAYNPVPVAYTYIEQKRAKIYSVTEIVPAPDLPDSGPGSTRVRGDELWVSTTDGWLRIDELQLEGSRRLPAAELLRGQARIPATLGRVSTQN